MSFHGYGGEREKDENHRTRAWGIERDLNRLVELDSLLQYNFVLLGEARCFLLFNAVEGRMCLLHRLELVFPGETTDSLRTVVVEEALAYVV